MQFTIEEEKVLNKYIDAFLKEKNSKNKKPILFLKETYRFLPKKGIGFFKKWYWGQVLILPIIRVA